jgi:hypothetical protein
MTDFTYRSALTRNLTAAEVDANFAGLAVGALNFYIPTVANQDYTIALKMRHGGSITEATTQSVSGTATATFKVNSTALGGSANACSSSVQSQTHVATNTFVAGDSIVVTMSANSSCLGLAINLRVLRTQT